MVMGVGQFARQKGHLFSGGSSGADNAISGRESGEVLAAPSEGLEDPWVGSPLTQSMTRMLFSRSVSSRLPRLSSTAASTDCMRLSWQG